jgi:hypothetical protein
MDFIPNDFNLVFGESSFLLVTGPNMGEFFKLWQLDKTVCALNIFCY